MSTPPIVIKRDERAFFVGATGSGKTLLAKALLWKQPNTVVLDTKRTFTLPDDWDHEYYSSVADMKSEAHDDITMIYRPDPDELDTGCEDFFRYAFERGNVRIFVDEASDVTKGPRIGRWYERCIRLGRELNVSTWSATQRPRNIPQVIMTESEHMFIFRLRSEDDRKRVAQFTADEILTKVPKGHGFWYYNDPKQILRYYPAANVGKLAT